MNIKRNFFRIVRLGNELQREVGESPLLEVFEKRLVMALNAVV